MKNTVYTSVPYPGARRIHAGRGREACKRGVSGFCERNMPKGLCVCV